MPSDLFSSSRALLTSPDARATLADIARQLEADLSPPDGGHWSETDWPTILTKADADLAKRITINADAAAVRAAWTAVATDFHRSGQWGFRPQSKKRVKPPTEGQKMFKEFLPYIWVFIQSTFLVKFAILYFGLNNAEEPSTFNLVGLLFFLALSFFSLLYFAWRRHVRENGKGD